VLEDLWLDTDDDSRRFYQALIHLATAYLHLFRSNLRGCAQRLASTLQYLSVYPDTYEGLDLRSIRDNIRLWQQRIAANNAIYDDADIPVLSLAGDVAQTSGL
jgi:predicted metal-dependent hydrolase